MDTSSASLKKTALTYGALLALLSIALQVISFVMDAHITRPFWLSITQMAITIGVVAYGIYSFKIENANQIALRQALKTGVAICLIASIIVSIFNYFFITYIDPQFLEKSLDYARMQMEMNPDFTAEQIDMSMQMSEMMMSYWYITAFSILGSLFLGFIISLITGLALRTAPQNYHS